MKFRQWPLWAAGVALAAAMGSAGATEFQVKDLGAGAAYFINERGDIGGRRSAQPTMWLSDGRTLGLTMEAPQNGFWEFAGLNNRGQSVLNVLAPDAQGHCECSLPYAAYIWSTDGSLKQIGGAGARLSGISDAGTAVGERSERALAWNVATSEETTVPGFDHMQKISRSGIGIGYADTPFALMTRNSDGQTRQITTTDESARLDYFNDVADDGAMLISGFDTISGRQALYLWEDGATRLLRRFEDDEMVTAHLNDRHETVINHYRYDADGGLEVLAALYWNGQGDPTFESLAGLLSSESSTVTDIRGFDINNLGQIAGMGRVDGQLRALVMSPVPEPSTLLLSLAGLAVIAWRHSCRQLRRATIPA